MSAQKVIDTTPKRRQTVKHSMLELNKTRWTPLDDVMLVQGIQQTSSIMSVFLGTKFSCKFTLKEVEERWDVLLYNSAISTTVMEDVTFLCCDERSFSEKSVLWSLEEEDILSQVTSQSEPHVQEFEVILGNNFGSFHPTRTANALLYHWSLLKKYNLLCDQTPSHIHSTPTQFSQALLGLKDRDLTQEQGHREMACLYEKRLQDKKQKVEVITLEKQLAEWKVLLEESLSQEFPSDTLASLRGKNTRFEMTSSRATIGRNTDEDSVDMDLSREGPALKVSRKQASIQFDSDKDKFYITNTGRCHIFVNDTPLMTENTAVLEDMSLVAFGELSFIFVINPCLPSQSSGDS